MNNKIYIASGLKNYKRVMEIRDKFAEYGIWLTYDWAAAYDAHIKSDKKLEDNLAIIAEKEVQAVKDCELLFLIAPGGRGTHFEMGMAYALWKPIVIMYENGSEKDVIAFHMLGDIERCIGEEPAIKKVLEILGVEWD